MDALDLYGVFGGTFDPIHHGHLRPIREMLDRHNLREIAYIPAGAPPHRPPPIAPPDARLAMTRLAVRGRARLRVETLEMHRAPSYTIDTLTELRRRHPRRRLALIAGLDALLSLERWRNWRDILTRAHLIALARPGWALPEPPPHWWQRAQVESPRALCDFAAGKIALVETAAVDISASMVRARLGGGQSIDALVPRAVREYIRAHHLYGG